MLTPDEPAHTFVEAEEMGEQLAAAALRALEQAPAAPLAEIAHARREVAVPLQNPVLQMAADRGLIPDPRDTAGRVNTEVSLTRLGPLWLAGVPGEMLPRLGLELRQAMRSAGAAHAAVIGLANDELGYILPEEDYVYPHDPMVPGDHYEETMSLGPAAGPAVMEALQDLIEGR